MSYENLLVLREDPIAIVQLNRPKVLNALNRALMQELVEALQQLDQDDKIRCLILTGDEKAFAAGADIREMVEAGPIEMLQRNTIGSLGSDSNPLKTHHRSRERLRGGRRLRTGLAVRHDRRFRNGALLAA